MTGELNRSHSHIVFVLGAGAHKGYGMPLASELKARILGRIQAIIHPNSAAVLLADPMMSQLCHDEHRTLLRDFEHSRPTIDEFLSDNFEIKKTREWGLRVIAREIMESQSGLETGAMSVTDDWIDWVFNELICPVDRDPPHDVRFVTFNYDTVLERRLAHKYKRARKTSWDDAYRWATSDDRVIHVYGTIKWPERFRGEEFPKTVVRDECVCHDVEYFQGAEGIKVIPYRERLDHTASSLEPHLERVRNWLYSSSRIIFLGFGFADSNLRMLGAHKDNADWQNVIKQKPGIVWGTAHGLVDGELKRAHHLLQPAAIWSLERGATKNDRGFSDFGKMDCKTYLRTRFGPSDLGM